MKGRGGFMWLRRGISGAIFASLQRHIIFRETEGNLFNQFKTVCCKIVTLVHGCNGRRKVVFSPSTPELNSSAQRCLPRFLLGILIFKGPTARRLYKSFGVKGLNLVQGAHQVVHCDNLTEFECD
jgi:hypothetical protein